MLYSGRFEIGLVRSTFDEDVNRTTLYLRLYYLVWTYSTFDQIQSESDESGCTRGYYDKLN